MVNNPVVGQFYIYYGNLIKIMGVLNNTCVVKNMETGVIFYACNYDLFKPLTNEDKLKYL